MNITPLLISVPLKTFTSHPTVTEWLKKYLSERFSEEDVSTAYELIEQLPKFNREGLIKILERMDELSELNKYLAQIDLVE